MHFGNEIVHGGLFDEGGQWFGVGGMPGFCLSPWIHEKA
jgi:hypothetical protein